MFLKDHNNDKDDQAWFKYFWKWHMKLGDNSILQQILFKMMLIWNKSESLLKKGLNRCQKVG